jgi:hypothetical protein
MIAASPYEKACLRLQAAKDDAQARGIEVDVSVVVLPATMRVRLESQAYVAEITVWETGYANVLLVDVGTASYLIDRSLLIAELDGPLLDVLDSFGLSSAERER